MRRFKFAILGLVVLALAACSETMGQKQGLGALPGAVSGGVVAPQVGKGRGKLIAKCVSTVPGALMGSEVGKSLDRADRFAIQHATQGTLERAPSGTKSTWHNPDSGNSGTVTLTQTYQRNDGAYCREFTQTATVGARTEEANGAAHRPHDGSWQII